MPDRGINAPACQAELSIYCYINACVIYVKLLFQLFKAANCFFGSQGNFFHILSKIPSVTTHLI
jgi:hypothetical protein